MNDHDRYSSMSPAAESYQREIEQFDRWQHFGRFSGDVPREADLQLAAERQIEVEEVAAVEREAEGI